MRTYIHLLLFLAVSGCAVIPHNAAELDDTAFSCQADHTTNRNTGRHVLLAKEQALTQRPLHAGNAVRLLVDGPANFKQQFADLRTAKHHIHLQTFILASDEIGNQVADILIERAKNGVEVRVIYDGLGSVTVASKAFFKRLTAAGVELFEFRPLDPLEMLSDLDVLRLHNRSHRKLLIIDGRIAYTGGINVNNSYLGSAIGSSTDDGSNNDNLSKQPLSDKNRWRDTHVRITGPATNDLQTLFLNTWREQHELPHPNAHYLLAEPAAGDLNIRVLGSKSRNPIGNMMGRIRRKSHNTHVKYSIYKSYLSAIAHADQRIWLTNAYFVPNHELLSALRAAACRGVDVRLMLPGESDQVLVQNASRSYYRRLMDAGVKIYERQGPVLHAKTALVDDFWSTVGSSNLDFQSLLHNSEVNVNIVDEGFNHQLAKVFLDDIKVAKQIDPETWDDRSVMDYLKQNASRFLKYWL